MPNVLIRDLPDDVHAMLHQRAAAAGQSLQQYLTDQLTRWSSTPTMAEVLANVARRRGGSVGLAEAATDLRAERDAR